ncbi:hypothetical protein [Methylibium petroleiphilum]|uniref:Uncharacterized protein n=1 Tax=Methylibium petroleiphilum (strain ATCC BAA-1232 / LMG 22953 / PM1) TaxID=420662 RepID=A2SN01_METPP|nr:hypothetical protein [Methylibium petroleiphilum]ABM96940.1 hypothetical protein Mpe_B0162 [Methylibium petroleiphilum PM1]
MRQVLLTTLLAISGALFGPSVAQAQTCGLLADPNNPACKGGTASPATPGAAAPAAAAATATDPRQAPGMGQKVCAFFDTKTNRCLTVRPDTKAYDSAVQTGIEAAMMGMQIQQDAIYRAGQMGVLGGFGRQAQGQAGAPLPQMPQGVTLPGATLPGVGLTVPGAAPESAAARQTSDSPLVACARQRITQAEKASGRPATPDEVAAAMRSCDTP